FTGPLDRLDWIFYWGDAVSMALMPALLLHFTLEFPERPPAARPNLTLIAPLVYAPAVVLGAARVMVVARGAADGAMFSRAIDFIERGEHIYLFVAAAAALAVLVKAFRQITSATGQRQLRWIAWGTGLGVGPFAVFYALPWALGVDPPLALQLTAIPLGLVPLTFASAVGGDLLRDAGIVIKRRLAYTTFYAASVALSIALRKLVDFGFAVDA